MKKRIVLIASVLVLVGVVILVWYGLQPESRVCAEEDAGRAIEFEAGDTFRVDLVENPSTGFSWHCSVDPETVIALEADQFTPAQEKEIVGAAGRHEFEFKALKRGEATVKFEYYRSFEPENIAETYVFNFVVR